MDHSGSTLSMSLALDGMLSTEERTAFDTHMGQCSECQAQWEWWQQVDELLTSDPVLLPSAGFSDRVLERVGQRSQQRRRLLRGALLVGGSLSVWGMAVVALAVAGLLWILSDPSVVVYFARTVSQLLTASGLLAKTVRIGLESVVRPSVWPWLASYACFVVALTLLWVRVIGLSLIHI